MKQLLIIIVALVLLLCACAKSERPANEGPTRSPAGKPEEGVIDPEGETSVQASQATMGESAGASARPSSTPPVCGAMPIESDEYTVYMAADTLLTIPGSPGRLLFSIGYPEHHPSFLDMEGLGHDSATFAARGIYARIVITAPAFELFFGTKKLEDNTIIVPVDSTGSEVLLTIVPTQKGDSEIHATIYMHNLPDCSDPGVPKVPPVLRIKVEVDHMQRLCDHVQEMLDIAWEKFLKFWGAFVAFILGLAFYIIRKKVKAKTGYSDENSQGGDENQQ